MGADLGGRGVLLGQALSRNDAADQLRTLAPDLVEEFVHLRKLLDQDDAAQRMTRGYDDTSRRMDIAERYQALIELIRARPGLDRFPAMPTRSVTRTDAEVVVVLNLSEFRSDAIVFGERVGDPIGVPLPDVTPTEADEQVRSMYATLARREDAAGDAAQVERVEAAVGRVLAWIWNGIVGPVLMAVRLDRFRPPGERPRVWWSPSGSLTLLPIQAATREASASGPALCALDCVVSSFIPTAAALRRESAPLTGDPAASIVAIPVTAGYRDLPGVVDEAESIARRYAGEPLIGPAATRAAVTKALQGSEIAHFACHAVNMPSDPSRSGLVVHDGVLTVAELSVQDLRHAHLAYLSACDTARGGMILTDEAITICSGLFLAGFAHAIGTLWPVGDTVAGFLADKFHDALSKRLDRGQPASQTPQRAGSLGTTRLAGPSEPVGGAHPRRSLSSERV